VPGRSPVRRADPGRDAAQREPELQGQTVVVIGGSVGIGLATARRRGTGLSLIGALTGAMPALVANLALRSRRSGST
jgi:hypothetical protein